MHYYSRKQGCKVCLERTGKERFTIYKRNKVQQQQTNKNKQSTAMNRKWKWNWSGATTRQHMLCPGIRINAHMKHTHTHIHICNTPIDNTYGRLDIELWQNTHSSTICI